MGIYQNTVFDPLREVRLWEDGDEVLGFAWLEEPGGVVMQVDRRLRASGSLEGEMLDWAARQTRASTPSSPASASSGTRITH